MPTRRRCGFTNHLAFFAMMTLTLFTAALFVDPRISQAAETAPRPNIIVIMADDVGYSDIGCFGGEIETPTLDRLATQGVRLSHFYNTGRCCPTRASLLTGRYPHEVGVGHMMEDRNLPGYRGDLSLEAQTIAERLKESGYKTAVFGKWHVTRFVNPAGPKHNWPQQRGFDTVYSTIVGAGNYFDPSALVRDNTMLTIHTDTEYPADNFYYTHAISDHAAAYVRHHHEQGAGEPFFMYLPYTAGHWPLHAPEKEIQKYIARYEGGYEPIHAARLKKLKSLGLLPDSWQPAPLARDWANVADKPWEIRCMATYAAMIDCMDQGIGRIVRSLEETGEIDNTLIVYLQDNGGCQEEVGRGSGGANAQKAKNQNAKKQKAVAEIQPFTKDHIMTASSPRQTRDGRPMRQGQGVMPGPEDTFIGYGHGWASVSNTPFREFKHFTHEGGISSACIINYPPAIKSPGRIDATPAHLIDLMPTFLELAGSPPGTKAPFKEGPLSRPLPGVSLVPLLAGEKVVRPQPLFWEHEGNRAIRLGDWKLVAKEKNPWELYDLSQDRGEQVNLVRQQPAKAKELEAAWDRWAAENQVLPLGGFRAAAPSQPDVAK